MMMRRPLKRRTTKQSREAINIDRALCDRNQLGAALGGIASWSIWLAALKAAFALPLNDDQQKTFAAISGNRTPPTKRVRELWCTIGRRAGKSRVAAALAVFIAAFVRHKLAPGEVGMVLVLGMTQEQAKVVYNAALAFLEASPVLRREIASTKRGEITLKNGIVIAIHSNSFRSVRGRTLVAAIFDEVAFWRDDTTAVPDIETYRAVLPALITTNGMLIGISSPYRRVGLLHIKHKRYFGVADDDILAIQGATTTFNPTLDESAIAAQREADPVAAKSEWDAEFRSDLETVLDDDLIERAIDRGRPLELPPLRGTLYKGFVDASGGAQGGDYYAFAVGHKEQGRFIIDVMRGRKGPFDPDEVTKEYAALCKQYGISSVTGDYYAAEWVTATWQRDANIRYEKSDLPKSAIYLEALPLFARGLVSLPDHQTLVRELSLLERSPTRTGKDQVSHPRGVNDDHANAACGVSPALEVSRLRPVFGLARRRPQ
jgi:terminase large subunit-like protein